MALINCSECGKEISDKAATCPFCGCPNRPVKKKRRGLKVLIIAISAVMLVVLLAGVYSYLDKNTTLFVSEDQMNDQKLMHYLGMIPLGDEGISPRSDTELPPDNVADFFNAKYAGTDKEQWAIDQIISTIYLGDILAYPKEYEDFANALHTDAPEFDTLLKAIAYLERLEYVSMYDLHNAPKEYYGKYVCVYGSLDKVDADRSSIYISGFECIENPKYKGEMDWDSHRSLNYGVVLAYGRITQYNNTDKPYMDMQHCVWGANDWEAIESLSGFTDSAQ